MELYNLLERALPEIGQTFNVSLNWIGELIRLLINGVGIVGVGIILFSLILKLIVLPCDIYQRVAMRKQNIKMEEQKERMEKLQKQYANDQEMYNQKVMEMYKENGISMFSSCLPMILSMVIFIGAINGFNGYSQYSAIQNYNDMVGAYKAKIESYCPDLETVTLDFATEGKITVKSADKPLFYRVPVGEYTSASDEATVKEYVKNSQNKAYYIDLDQAEMIPEIGAAVTPEKSLSDVAYEYFVGEAQAAVKTCYETEIVNRTKFLWIENIWATDAAQVHPVLSFTEFEAKAKTEKFDVNGEQVDYVSLAEKTGTKAYTQGIYDEITGKLDVQKTAPNGYYVLILLSIGTILLQQFVSMRSQKAQNKYSTVDGQGASQQKMMMFMMTAMFAFFSFMYSGAFSIYLVVSNVFSLASTLIINKVVDGIMEKKSLQETITKYDNRMLSRIEAAKNSGRESAKESREKKMEKAVEPKKETTPPQTTENKPVEGAETNETVEGDKEQGE